MEEQWWPCARCGSLSPATASSCRKCGAHRTTIQKGDGGSAQLASSHPNIQAAVSQGGGTGAAPAREPGARLGAGDLPIIAWEYRHVFVGAQEREGTGYAYDDVNKKLNELGRDGWELLNMEAHWIWLEVTHGAPMWAMMLNDSRRKVEAAASHPEYIVGWYCTFRRQRAAS